MGDGFAVAVGAGVAVAAWVAVGRTGVAVSDARVAVAAGRRVAVGGTGVRVGLDAAEEHPANRITTAINAGTRCRAARASEARSIV